MKLFLRLTAEVNDGLRSLLRYRGDLSRFIEEALSRADLMRFRTLRYPGRAEDRDGQLSCSAFVFLGLGFNTLPSCGTRPA